MSLNKQNGRGNMYDWVTHTWNPLGGLCPHECSYCSTNALLKRSEVLKKKYSGKPYLVGKEMKTLGKGKTIFVCNMTDLFAKAVPHGIISDILKHCSAYDNTYLFQSKNPLRFCSFKKEMPKNIILCTTLESNRDYYNMTKAPWVYKRVADMRKATGEFPWAKISITIEPVMDFDLHIFLNMIKIALPTFVSIGADSKRSGLNEPSSEKLSDLLKGLAKFTTIERKTNLARLLKE